jgi:uncharacterized protein (TIGR03083 family)
MLAPLPLTDTRSYFRPLFQEFGTLLAHLPADAWLRPTIAGRWRVRDVVAHMVDTGLRRLSFHRDRLPPPTLPADMDIVQFINALNAEFVALSARFSPEVLRTLHDHMAGELAAFVETVPLDAPALFPVSWAGETESQAWFDIGRDFTEYWHHQMQVRDAVGGGEASRPEWLHSVLCIALRALPHQLRDIPKPSGTVIQLEISGPAGGAWAVVRDDASWVLRQGHAGAAAVTLKLTDGALVKTLFNALPLTSALAASDIAGDITLAAAVLRTRGVIV